VIQILKTNFNGSTISCGSLLITFGMHLVVQQLVKYN